MVFPVAFQLGFLFSLHPRSAVSHILISNSYFSASTASSLSPPKPAPEAALFSAPTASFCMWWSAYGVCASPVPLSAGHI